MSVRTVASAARNPAALTAICPVAEKRFPTTSQLLPQVGEFDVDPLHEPTKAVLLGEAPDVFRRPFGSLSCGVDELGKTVYLVDQHRQEDPYHEQQHHQHPQVGEPYGQRALDQAVTPLELRSLRQVEHRCQKRAMTSQPMNVRTCQREASATSTTTAVSKAAATVRTTCEVGRPAPPLVLAQRHGAAGRVGVVLGFSLAVRAASRCVGSSPSGVFLVHIPSPYRYLARDPLIAPRDSSCPRRWRRSIVFA